MTRIDRASRALAFVLTFAAWTTLWAATHSVPGDFPTIQAAIDAASNGDVVEVAPGTYLENIDFSNKSITVRGTAGADSTTIDGSALTAGPTRGSVVILNEGGGVDPLLEGFTITGGSGSGSMSGFGGGVYCYGAGGTIRDCRITLNTAEEGGGLSARELSAALAIENCQFIENSAPGGEGGGLYVFGSGSLTLVGCEFIQNSASYGGGGVVSTTTFDATDCAFSENTLSSSFGQGGGLVLGPLFPPTSFFDVEQATLTNCDFTANEAGFGGGAISALRANTRFVETRFLENSAGTGVAILNDSGNVELEYCVLARNESGPTGEVITSSVNGARIEIDHCTIVDNQCGGGVFHQGVGPAPLIDPVLIVTNSIAQSNLSGNWSLGPGVDATYAYSNLATFSAADGAGIIDEDPAFVDFAGGDYRLALGSPCIDAGDPAFPLDSDGTITDMGALPVLAGTAFVRGDANQDGILDLADGIFVLEAIIQGTYVIACEDAADANSDGTVTVADPIFVFSYRFFDGPPPAAPFPECGLGGEGPLDCVSAPGCAP